MVFSSVKGKQSNSGCWKFPSIPLVNDWAGEPQTSSVCATRAGKLEISSQLPLLYVSHIRQITPQQGCDISWLPLIISTCDYTDRKPSSGEVLPSLFLESEEASELRMETETLPWFSGATWKIWILFHHWLPGPCYDSKQWLAIWILPEIPLLFQTCLILVQWGQ